MLELEMLRAENNDLRRDLDDVRDELNAALNRLEHEEQKVKELKSKRELDDENLLTQETIAIVAANEQLKEENVRLDFMLRSSMECLAVLRATIAGTSPQESLADIRKKLSRA